MVYPLYAKAQSHRAKQPHDPNPLAPAARITQAIRILRRQKVLLDADLAALYGATTKRFHEHVRRNRDRFPADFMSRVTPTEDIALRSQIATSNVGRGGRRYLPYAFTEHGAIIAAIRELMASPEPEPKPKRPIGFEPHKEK